jgi:hypothetical protein
MRTVLAVAGCLVVGACATFGGGVEKIYGVYDVTSLNGAPLPNEMLSSGWLDWKPDGSWTGLMTPAGGAEPEALEGQTSVGEEADGCIPLQIWPTEAPEAPGTGTVCDGVMTVNVEGIEWVLHKRH